jgi:uncharacterized membrane protein HdeD (DUF308 family)
LGPQLKRNPLGSGTFKARIGNRSMWRRLLGGICVLWGGALLFQHFTRARHEHFNKALMTGRLVAYAMAAFIFLIGVFLLLRSPRSTSH